VNRIVRAVRGRTTHGVMYAVLLALVASGVAATVHRGGRRPAQRSLAVGALPDDRTPDGQLLSWAEQVLAGRCMTRRGFEYTVDWVVDPTDGEPDYLPYGTTDVADAARNGYGIGPRTMVARAGSAPFAN
jgi:hypothetical protein